MMDSPVMDSPVMDFPIRTGSKSPRAESRQLQGPVPALSRKAITIRRRARPGSHAGPGLAALLQAQWLRASGSVTATLI
jgi:hypothetical protein